MIEMDYESYKAYRREIVRKSQQKRRDKARAEGLCVGCCSRAPEGNKTLCARCNEMQKKAQRRYNKGLKRGD